MRRLPIVLGSLALLAACGAEEPVVEPPVRPVKSLVVQPFGQQPTIFSGTVEPQVSTDYSFQILGRLVDRLVDVGDTVSEGALLATLDARVQEQDVQAAEAALASAEASLANAGGVATRQRALQTSSFATQAAVEDAEQLFQSARSAELQARASLDQTRERLDDTRIVADFAGIVTAVSAEDGQVVSPGESVLTVARPDLRDAVIDLPGPFADLLAIGAPLPVALELDPSVSATGTVREIAPLADPVTRSRRVRVALREPPEGFRLGTIVRVALTGDEAQALALPEAAILRRDGETFVWVISAGGDAVALRSVAVREAGDGRWAVESGLEGGERVVAAGVNSLSEGQRVRIEEATP